MGFAPDIMHCNDWQTGLIPLMLKTLYSWDRLFSRTRTVLTLHNVAYQGVFSASTIDVVGMGEYRLRFDNDDLRYGIVNWMKTGIFYADAITTVSKTYAKEIRTAEGGAGLDHFLRQRGGAVVGIVNGVDYNEWSPEKDTFIKYNYSINDLSGKEASKQDLLHRVNLTYDPQAPVLGIVSRLTDQKGFDLMFDTIDQVLSRRNIRLVVLGSGDERYEKFFSGVQARHRGKVCYYKGYSNELAHLIEAGADIFLMPSRFEPCGLNQIYSLRYGTVPVVRKTGGLADTVQQFDPTTGNGTGFVFRRFSPKELYWAIEFAIHTWHNRPVWRQIMRNGMKKNYSWEAQVQQYLRLYLRLTS
ncbi:MAG: glycogen synthase [Chlorobi bacterium OLB7]|nr:MAG: glycogen synthase [Chlorobi bacterium OLB7]